MEAFFSKKLGEREGTTKDGKPWKVVQFLIKTKGKYPKMVSLDAWNASADIVNSMRDGDMIEVTYEAEAKEYNNKWYNALKVVSIESLETEARPIVAEEPSDDLPF
jgi:hypothetical protein